MPYSLIIYDADGTLFDYNRAERWAFEQMCIDLEIEFTKRLHDSYREINHGIWKEFEQGTITGKALKVERYQRLFTREKIAQDATEAAMTYLSRLGEAGFLLDGAYEHLERVSESFPLALLTNGVAATQHGRLKASGIGHFFDPIIISEEVGAQKPDPKIFEILMARTTGIAKASVLIIGDSLTSDIAGGAAYGIDTCLFDPLKEYEHIPEGLTTPTFRVTSFSALEELLNKS